MTAAERKHLSRQKLSQEGGTEQMVKIEGTEMQAIDSLAQAFGLKQKDFLRSIFSDALKRVACIAALAALMKKEGKTDNEVAIFLHEHLHPDLPTINELTKEAGRH